MKKLIVAAMIAGSMMVMAEEAGKPAEAPKAAATTATAVPRRQITPEQRAAMKAKFEERMAARKAEMEKKALDVIKKYGLDDEKAKALLADLEAVMKPARRPRPNMKRPAKSAAPVQAE